MPNAQSPTERRRAMRPMKLSGKAWLLAEQPDEKDAADAAEGKSPKLRGAIVVKSKSSQIKIKPDEAKQLYKDSIVVEPYININLLSAFYNTSSIHSICVQRKARVIAGLGIKAVTTESERKYRQIVRKDKRKEKVDPAELKEAEAKLKKMEEEGKKLREWIDTVGDDIPLREILERAWTDYESIGWFGLEVIRDAAGRVAGLVHIPAPLIRRAKDRERFVYLKSPANKVWFKSFGNEKHLNVKTGAWGDDRFDDTEEANEIIFWYQYSMLDPFYGIPGWYAAMSEILGAQEARDFMLFYFTRRATPTYAVILEGGTWGAPVINAIRNFFRRDLTGDYHATLVIEIPEGGKLTFERMTDEPRWVILIQQYLGSLRDAIVSAHGLSPALVGIIETASLGAGTGSSQLELFKSLEGKPKQETLENILNNLIVKKGLKLETQMLKLDELDVFDEQAEVTAIGILFSNTQRPTITLNEARKRLRYDPADEEWADEFLVMSQGTLVPLSQLENPDFQKQGQQPPGFDFFGGQSGDLTGVDVGAESGNGNGNQPPEKIGVTSPTNAPQVGVG